jgi:hypothetical protein
VTPADRSTQTARSPGQAAAGATRTARATHAHAGNDPEAEPAAAAAATTTTAAANSAAGATNAASAASADATATATATVTTAATAAAACHLQAPTANVFLVEEIERGETDVGHLLFAKNETLIGHGIAGLRDVGRWRRGRGCAPDQRKAQSGGTQHLDGTGFAFTSLPRSLFDP